MQTIQKIEEHVDRRLGDWTDERVELLKRLWEKGLSATLIANEIGSGVTRNMVCGKLNRLNLKREASAETRQVQAEIRESLQIKAEKGTVGSKAGGIISRIKAKIRDGASPAPTLKIVHTVVDEAPLHIGLMELADDTCRWPYADDGAEATYCGCATKLKSSYCYSHHARAHQKATYTKISDEERQRRSNQWRATAETKRREQFRQARI